jgi:hypothetical protein
MSAVPFVAATIHNAGQGPLDISGTLTFSNGPGGIRGGPFPVTLGSPLAPGGTETATVVLAKSFPTGPWNAAIRLTSGLTIRSAIATLTFPGVAAAVPARSRPLILVVALLLVLVASAALALQPLRRRARSRTGRRRVPAGVPVSIQPSPIDPA